MGKTHLVFQWPKLLWSHLCIDHMYFFARNRRILSKFSCFAMEGGHRPLQRLLRNGGGRRLQHGRLAVQAVVDNHTIDDSLCGEGWDVTERSMRGQGGVPSRGYLVTSMYKSSHSVSDAAPSGGPRTFGHGIIGCGGSMYLSWCTPHSGGARMREDECENDAIWARICCIFTFALPPHAQGKPAVGLGHFVGHRGTVACEKGAVSFDGHPDFFL